MAYTNQERTVAPEIRGVYNGTGSTINRGTIVKLKTSSPLYAGEIVKAAAATDILYGVTLQDIPDKTFGDCAIRGIVPVVVGAAGLAVGSQVTSDASGLAIAASAGNVSLGLSLNTGALVSGDYAEVEINPIAGEAN